MAVATDGSGAREWVLARPLYRFGRFDLKAVPKAQRAPALQMQIRQWTPFTRTGWYLAWEGDQALVWAWDEAKVEAAMGASDMRPKGTQVVPETLLHRRQYRGAYLVSSLEGFEGQVWRDNSLLSSRWWSSLPSAVEWLAFQRDGGVAPEDQSTTVPQPSVQELAERAWSRSEALDTAAASRLRGERLAVPALGLMLLAAMAWYGGQSMKMRMGIDARERELAALSERAEPMMIARRQALEALERIESLQAALERYPDQLSLMAKVAEALPRDGTYVTSWDYRSGTLKVQLVSASALPTSDYIKRVQAVGAFAEVQATPNSGGGGLTLSMEVLPRSAARAPAANMAAKQ